MKTASPAATVLISNDKPLVLLPVRLETRFFRNGTQFELWIRVFPDKIYVDTHEPQLTDEEVLWGNTYRDAWAKAQQDNDKKACWRQLVNRFGAPRAAWIKKQIDNHSGPLTATGKLESWTRAPHSKVLPDKWIAIAHFTDGRKRSVYGNSIIPPNGKAEDSFPFGPKPEFQSDGTTQDANIDDLIKDAGIEWLTDFKVAENLGMAIRMPLVEADLQGIKRLLVFGVKTSLSSAQSAERLHELLTSHQFSNGINIIAPGTPTNNTPDAPSGFSTQDRGHEISYDTTVANPYMPGRNAQSNGDLLRVALGSPKTSDTFAGVAEASSDDCAAAKHMNVALWQSTWGYYLEQMMTGFWSSDSVDENLVWIRKHFIEYVRPGGPLPTIRVGKQPYGLLPVTALNTNYWASTDSKANALVQLLKQLRDFWIILSKENKTPKLGRTNDPQQDLKEVLQHDALSSSFQLRNVNARAYFYNLLSLIFNVQAGQTQGETAIGLSGKAVLSYFELTPSQTPRIVDGIVYSTDAKPFNFDNFPLVLPKAAQAEISNYIDELLKTTNLEALSAIDVKGKPLVYLLLRHSMLLEYVRLSVREGDGSKPFIPEREQEFVNIPGATDSGLTAGLTTFQKLIDLEKIGKNPLGWKDARLSEFRNSLEQLKSVFDQPDLLSRYMIGTLDASSYRLDAWITSCASARLNALRQFKMQPDGGYDYIDGVYLGGYGWIENLKPKDTLLDAPNKGTAPLVPSDNPGYTHTPSLGQAATVAVLRNGHLSYAGTNSEKSDLLAINLTSERVRTVSVLLRGIRNGQPLGALLGYRFERALHENYPTLGYNRYIAKCREIAPLKSKKLDSDGEVSESVQANHVVDGWRLHNLYKEKRESLLLEILDLEKPDPQLPAYNAIKTEILEIGNLLDALSDALLAESTHHVVQGNPIRAAASLEAIGRGETPPAELEVVKTPRTGRAVTHREVVLFNSTTAMIAGWNTIKDFDFRVNAEPRLNAWMGRLFGNPEKVRIVAEAVDPKNGAVVVFQEFGLDKLGLNPLDILYMPDTDGIAETEFEQRILYYLERLPKEMTVQTKWKIRPDYRKPGWSSDLQSFEEFLELLRTIRRLINGTRALNQNDVTFTALNESNIDLAELEARFMNTSEAFVKIKKTLEKFQETTDTVESEDMRYTLLQMACFGIPGAIPKSALGNDAAAKRILFQQKATVIYHADQRVKAKDEIIDKLKGQENPTVRAKLLVEGIQALFGNQFLVLPLFKSTNRAELTNAFAASSPIQGDDPLAVVTWHQRASRVHDGISRFHDVFLYTEAFATGERMNLHVAQLPFRENDRWVGLPLTSEQNIPFGRLSLIAHIPENIDFNNAIAGLYIGEIADFVPHAKETTGIVYQYDQPNSVAPQAVLLAVPPDMTVTHWTENTLEQVLIETLELAHIRAVGPEALEELSQFLPALHFSFNTDNETVSTDFVRASS